MNDCLIHQDIAGKVNISKDPGKLMSLNFKEEFGHM